MKTTKAKIGRAAKNERILLKTQLFSIAFGLLGVLLLLSLTSVLIIRSDISKEYIPFIAISASCIGTFIAGFFACMKIKKRGLMFGAIIGSSIFAVYFIISVILKGGNPGLNTVYFAVATVAGGCLGGVCGVNMKRK